MQRRSVANGESSTLNPKPRTLNPLWTPRPGRIKGGESTQTIGASFWLQRLLIRIARSSRDYACKRKNALARRPQAEEVARAIWAFGWTLLNLFWLSAIGRRSCSENALAWRPQAEKVAQAMWAFGWTLLDSFRLRDRPPFFVPRMP